jgi:hypothetical protein
MKTSLDLQIEKAGLNDTAVPIVSWAVFCRSKC